MNSKELRKVLKEYIRHVKGNLKCSRRYKDEFFDGVEDIARECLRDKPNATKEELFELIGDPQTLIANFVKRIGPDEIRKSYRRSKWITIGIVVFVLVALAAGALWWLYDFMYNYTNITIIEYPVQ